LGIYARAVLRRTRALAGVATNAVRSRVGRGERRSIAAKNAEISALKRELARSRGDASVAFETPVFFVVGQQKSGTTWLMRMLDAHPEILCRGEGRFFGQWRQKSLVKSGEMRPPSSLLYALREAEYLRLWVERSVWSRNDGADEHLHNLARMAVDYFLRGELAKTGKRMVGDKSPLLTAETVEEISAVYPEARLIHIIRDGRDAAVSAAHHARNFGRARETKREDGGLFEETQLRKLAADWSARVGRTVEDGPRLFGDRYVEVRYEDLLVQPEREMARLLRFLGADEGGAGRCVVAASFERLSEGRTRGEEDPSSFFRKGVAGDWRGSFTEGDRRVFEEEAGGLLAKLGYGESGGT
jgi:Sulfotransferase family